MFDVKKVMNSFLDTNDTCVKIKNGIEKLNQLLVEYPEYFLKNMEEKEEYQIKEVIRI